MLGVSFVSLDFGLYYMYLISMSLCSEVFGCHPYCAFFSFRHLSTDVPVIMLWRKFAEPNFFLYDYHFGLNYFTETTN